MTRDLDTARGGPFRASAVSNEWLDDIAIAFEAAYGAFTNLELAAMLAAEFKTRKREMPAPYAERRDANDYRIDPEAWLQMFAPKTV